MKKTVSSTRMMSITVVAVVVAMMTTNNAAVDAFQSSAPTTSFLANNHQRQAFPKTTSTIRKTPSHHSSPFRHQHVSPASSTSALQASPLAALASSPLGSLSVLAGIVLFHEAGHYLAAKSFGMTVEEFSIGFGPRLAGFRAFGEEFNLRALPLGGYVRFPENYNNTEYELSKQAALENFKQEKEAQKLRRQEQELDLGSRLLNIVTFGAVLQQRKRRLEKEQEESSEQASSASSASSSASPSLESLWKKNQEKEEESAVFEKVDIEYYDDPDLLQNRPWPQRAVVLSAGVIFNLLLSFFIYFGTIGFGAGLPSPVFAPGVVVKQIPRPEAAAQGILKPGDVILGMNGSPLTPGGSSSTLSSTNMGPKSGAEAQKAISKLIAQIRATPDGQDIQLQVLRNSAGKADLWKDDASNLERKQQVVSVKPQRSEANAAQTIGVLLSPNVIENRVLQTKNPIEAAGLAAQYAGSLTRDTAAGLASFFGEMLSFSSKSTSTAQVSGPIGLIKTGTEVIATNDVRNVLLFAAAISINLGVVNAFPLPALDGGQLIFVLAEAITGRKVDQRLQEGITGASLVFLLAISAGAAFGDIASIFGF